VSLGPVIKTYPHEGIVGEEMPSAYVRLVERSKIAKECGGPEKIGKLPMLERLRVSARIARELGREKQAEHCASLAVQKAISNSDYQSAEATAREYKLVSFLQLLDAFQKIV